MVHYPPKGVQPAHLVGKGGPARTKASKVLTRQQLKVLGFYYGASNFNKTDALRRAGYSTPHKQHAFYSTAKIKAEMERRELEFREKYDITYERVMQELARIAFSSPLDYVDIDENGFAEVNLSKLDANTARAIGEIVVETHTELVNGMATEFSKVKVKPWGKLEALDKVIRHAGLSKEKTTADAIDGLADRIRAAQEQVRVRPVKAIEGDCREVEE